MTNQLFCDSRVVSKTPDSLEFYHLTLDIGERLKYGLTAHTFDEVLGINIFLGYSLLHDSQRLRVESVGIVFTFSRKE